MSEEKECEHPGTTLVMTKSKLKRVCVLCGEVLEDLSEEVTIEKVVLPMPDVEKVS